MIVSTLSWQSAGFVLECSGQQFDNTLDSSASSSLEHRQLVNLSVCSVSIAP